MEVNEKEIDDLKPLAEQRGSQVVHVRGNSDSEMEALFGVLEPTSSRPLQKPLKMRNLPASFFSPPQHRQSPVTLVSHSREGSSDSTYGGGTPVRVGGAMSPSPPQPQHFRHHSSPASLQQSLSVAPQNHVHAKQHSFDALSDDLPGGWEEASTPTGQIYYINHNTQTTTWDDPRKKVTNPSTGPPPLPTIQPPNLQPIPSPQPQPSPTPQSQQLILTTTSAHLVTSTAPNLVVSSSNNNSQNGLPALSQVQSSSSTTTSSTAATNNNAAAGTLQNKNFPLPDGWEQGVSPDGEVYYMNHNDKSTSWFDPRIPRHLQTGVGSKALTASPLIQSPQQSQSGQANQQLVHTLPPLAPNGHLSSQSRLQRLQIERTKLKERQQELMRTSIPALASSVNTALVLSPTLSIAHSSNELMNSSDPFMAATEIHNRQGSADSGLGLGGAYTHPHTPEDFLAHMEDSDSTPADSLKACTSSPMIVGSEIESMDSEDLVPSITINDDIGVEFLNDICLEPSKMNLPTWL